MTTTDIASENDTEKETSELDATMEESEEMATPTDSETDNSAPMTKKTG